MHDSMSGELQRKVITMNKHRHRYIFAILLSCAMLSCSVRNSTAGSTPEQEPFRYKNIIVMIPDGCDYAMQTVARWMKGAPLHLDKMLSGGVEVYMANSIITCSAASGTAFATGHKTSGGFLGVGPRAEDLLPGIPSTVKPYAPIASILEAARLQGKATGLVATSRISHATPAAFAAHVHARGMEDDITEQLVHSTIDLVLGGGARHLFPQGYTHTTSYGGTWNGVRPDGKNLFRELLDGGYTVIDHRDSLLKMGRGPVWGMFDENHMQPEIDREHFAPHQPSLADMVRSALDVLSKKPNGFFLLVEGSQVDWAGHANDPTYMVTEFLAFDSAVGLAAEFVERDGKTLLLAFPDHNTGGLKIGHYDMPKRYTEMTVEDLVTPLKKMRLSSSGLSAKMNGDYSAGNIAEVVSRYWSIDLTQEQALQIADDAIPHGITAALSRTVSKHYTIIGWTSFGHTGEMVPLWVYGAKDPITGVMENTDMARIAAKATGLNLEKTTQSLYVDLTGEEIEFSIDSSHAEGLVVRAGEASFPVNRNYALVDGQKVSLPGLTVYAPKTGNVYLSQDAIDMIKKGRRDTPTVGMEVKH